MRTAAKLDRQTGNFDYPYTVGIFIAEKGKSTFSERLVVRHILMLYYRFGASDLFIDLGFDAFELPGGEF